MTDYSIPVDIFNPGQVFACLGFMEAADVLLGDAEGGFDWTDESNVRFVLHTANEKNPFEEVLEFLAKAKIVQYMPERCHIIQKVKGKKKNISQKNSDERDMDSTENSLSSNTFPSMEGDAMALPCRLTSGTYAIEIGHWADGSSREKFKLYAGNRSAIGIACAMLNRINHLWKNHRNELVTNPFNVLTPLGGSFNFDPRGTWTSIDAGYSPNDVKHGVNASPVVELLTAIGFEHARPFEYDKRKIRYGVWQRVVPPILARTYLMGLDTDHTNKQFRFELALSGKNKIVTYAKEENKHE
ncbi:MAG: type I-U CRISPR-associated protein Cas8c [Candidatus Thermoplasmatota archaeon]|nr:type I-U CRISPR-associated protein Cas8c [Euryarchaeota archaeon]MBU4032774.1 type I-U CRISPR-associated protein Cas8c [Candidatus Thermoplasmatota archaeon]MBU4071771.1 type I-U CRISPR-associated protein Cas8c [Candidatus Thermoplasmatota archaeon]MBU4143546.1 type I-U CRISPR-associated protein Cas8c [Candidatus Thermoplasmatota archaeon]MBU4591274.1 type I-U CRISPR-associated protein Cas8c [Candidatus Thermoplasmatota archaeon]